MERKIYVGNLPTTFENADLELLFRNFGNIVSAKVYNYSGSQFFGKYGFVEMTSESEAINAAVRLNNFYLTGRRIVVANLVPR